MRGPEYFFNENFQKEKKVKRYYINSLKSYVQNLKELKLLFFIKLKFCFFL